jgi:hypothetical protein
MPIQYTLRPLTIPNREGKFAASVLPTYILRFEDVIGEVAQQANCSEGMVQNIMSAYMDVIERHFFNGATVYVGNIGRIFPSLTGCYESLNDNASKANLNVNFNVSRSYATKLLANVSLEKVMIPPKEPTITSVQDMTMQVENLFTMGGIVSILGDKLDFDVKNLEEGVFVEAEGYEGLVRIHTYGQHGIKHIDFALPSTFFTNKEMSVVTETGITFTVKCNYGSQTLHTKKYATSVYQGAFGASTKLTGFVGITGSAQLRAIRDDVGEGIKMAYQEHNVSAFGTAVAIAATTNEKTYTLFGNDPINSLTVKVKGKQFYDYIANTGIANGEFINPEIYVI